MPQIRVTKHLKKPFPSQSHMHILTQDQTKEASQTKPEINRTKKLWFETQFKIAQIGHRIRFERAL